MAIEFRNRRDPQGYRLERRSKEWWIRRIGREEDPLVECLPLRGEEYRLFKAIQDKDAALRFVSNYGPLSYRGDVIAHLRDGRVDDILREAERWRDVLDTMGAGPPQLSYGMLDHLSLNTEGWVRRSLVWDPAKMKIVWQEWASTLYGALLAQFLGAITGDTERRKCEFCGDWFEVGRGGGRRLDAKFCSDKHRKDFNNQVMREKREKASA